MYINMVNTAQAHDDRISLNIIKCQLANATL